MQPSIGELVTNAVPLCGPLECAQGVFIPPDQVNNPGQAGGHDRGDYQVAYQTSRLVGLPSSDELYVILPGVSVFTNYWESYRTHFYVPQPKTSSSGVTIAHGLDFGQFDFPPKYYLNILDGLILPPGSYTLDWWSKTLASFYGVKHNQAVNLMTTVNASITDAERLALLKSAQFIGFERAVFTDRLLNAREAWNGYLGRTFNFYQQRAELQTLLFDLTYQYGNGFLTSNKLGNQLLVALQKSDWATAAALLNPGNASCPSPNVDPRLCARLDLISTLRQ